MEENKKYPYKLKGWNCFGCGKNSREGETSYTFFNKEEKKRTEPLCERCYTYLKLKEVSNNG